jgi:NAD(P)-dependent dehydrogenase (short-subunit alcohol dehydrogenase family)
MSGDLFSVERKIVVITGGMGQLGRQFARALARRGARVAILDVAANEEQARERFGVDRDLFLFLKNDVTNRPEIESALRVIEEKWGTPDALINNAAIDSPPGAPTSENGPFEHYTMDSFERVMDVNVKGVFQCCQVFGGAMARTGRGSIINVSSVYGLVSPDQRIYQYREEREGAPFFKPAAYAVSKSALLNLTRYLSTYWASRNVRVNSLTLGGVFNQQDAEFLKGYDARVPLGRMAREDEYNGAVIYLVSEASSYMTGSNVVIDGGYTAW